MGTDDRRASLEAELELLDAEERLIAAKGDKKTRPDALQAIKDEVRELRRTQREAREGSATAQAQPAQAKASAKSTGR